MDLSIKIDCPHCGCPIDVDTSDFEIGTTGYEREMGTELQHEIECDDFECPHCGKRFSFSGSVWEYPIGAVNEVDVTAEAADD